ncbi:hypothetical protein DH86_00002584 [Scytalidium sp. 3C]|nr:hypothetical protein DH86_00002584 [Scytalidium sp. 3C]
MRNNYGVGATRKEELKGSCAALSIDPERCIALDREELQDNPKVWWDQNAIVAAVKEHVERWKVDAIVTFDQGGISGHLNHRAVSSAIRIIGALFSRANNVDGRYGDKALIANGWRSYLRTRQAFASHDSQYSWDRHVYMILSRQVWYNDLYRAKQAN